MTYEELRQELWKFGALQFVEPPAFKVACILSHHDWDEVKATMELSKGDLQDSCLLGDRPHTICGFNIYESANVEDGQPRFILEHMQ
jgi:hypothetical protein